MDNAVLAIVPNPHQKDHILWIKRRDLPIWVLPGGGIDPQETPEEALFREVHEETGLNVSIERKGAILTPINRLSAKTYLYVCSKVSGIEKTGEETADIGYFPLHTPPEPHFPLHDDWSQEVLRSSSLIERSITEITFSKVASFFVTHPIILLRYLLTRISKN